MNRLLSAMFMVDLKMKSSHVTFIYLTIIGLIGWNVFLAQRDQKLYDSFDKIKHSVPVEQLSTWHPKDP